MRLIDTHCHIDVEAFDGDREAVLAHCHQLGIERIIVPGIHAAGWDQLDRVCQAHAGLYPAYGLHPVYLEQHTAADIDRLAARLRTHRPVAVGEIGLDFFLAELDRARQQALFEAQLELAQQEQLPVILHVRKSHDVVLSTLRRIPVPGGICHAFNGSLQQAHQFIDLGFKLGFGGMLTYERSHKLKRLAQQLPLEAIVLETDAPDMTVSSHHGERNSPEYLPECLAALAEIRSEAEETVAAQTTANAEALFGFSAAS